MRKYTEIEASLFYDNKIILYSNGDYKEIRYTKKLHRLKDNFESNEMEDKLLFGRISSNTSNDNNIKEIRSDSLTRTRNLLIDYACENEKQFYTFVTLTFKENITDISFANKCFSNFIRSIKRVYPGFKYLGVPEFQKRGAVHYHLLTNLSLDSHLIIKQKDKENMYDVKYWRYGFSSVFDLINKTDEKFNIALYICKYLYKDIDNRLFGHNKILKSNNLKKPDIFLLEKQNKAYSYAYDYIKEKEYHISNKFIISNSEYSIPASIYSSKLNDEDINHLKDYLRTNNIK